MRTRHFVLLLDVMRCLELAASTAGRWAAGLTGVLHFSSPSSHYLPFTCHLNTLNENPFEKACNPKKGIRKQIIF